jgi:hypothetical protein
VHVRSVFHDTTAGCAPEQVLVVRGLALGRDDALGKALLAELRGELRLLLLAFGRHIRERACGWMCALWPDASQPCIR